MKNKESVKRDETGKKTEEKLKLSENPVTTYRFSSSPSAKM